jgi:hypothetical protein
VALLGFKNWPPVKKKIGDVQIHPFLLNFSNFDQNLPSFKNSEWAEPTGFRQNSAISSKLITLVLPMRESFSILINIQKYIIRRNIEISQETPKIVPSNPKVLL